MTIIKQTDNGISVTGHAGYAEAGKDIVCAGVSVLVQTMIASIEELTTDKIQYDIQPAMVNIQYGDLSEQARLLVNSFFVGVEMIANEYPHYVRVSKH